MDDATDVEERLLAKQGDRDAVVLGRLIAELSAVSDDSRRRLIETICIFFRIAFPETPSALDDARSIRPSGSSPNAPLSASPNPFRFSEPESTTPKEFMLRKSPTTDVERVACLAYYLTHFRSLPHFKTKDLSDLNTEAAQRRFSNAAFAVVNATNCGFLVPSVKGCKQLSAAGEQFVQALPDRDAAREAFDRLNWKRARRARKTLTKTQA
jgi:hypothetical protein